MARVEESVQVAAPRKTVWDLLADPLRHSELGTFVEEVKLVTPGEVGEGTVYRERSGPGSMKSESEWTITKFDPPRELVHVTNQKSMTAEATWMLTEVSSESTRVTQVLEFQMMPRLRVLGRLLEGLFATRMTQRETERMLRDTKRIVESEASPS